MTKVSIIIINWNGRYHLETCLRAVYSQTYKQFEVILVDNGSSDDSMNYIKNNWPQVKLISLAKNFGFAEGNNIGIGEALKDKSVQYVCLLNNDTEVTPNWLNELVTIMATDQKIGAVCSKTIFFDRRDIIDGCGDFIALGTLKVVTRGHGEVDKGQYNQNQECFSARAAAALYRREMLEDIVWQREFFDSKFFAYVEDTDLSIRARLRGWSIWYCPTAVVFHKVAATSDKISSAFRHYYSGRNRIFLAIKCFPFSWWRKALGQPPGIKTLGKINFGQSLVIYARILFSVCCALPRLLGQWRDIRQNKKINREEIDEWTRKFVIR